MAARAFPSHACRAAQEMPRWLSSTKMETVKSSAKILLCCSESMVRLRRRAQGLPSKDVDAFLDGPRARSRYCCASRAPPQPLCARLDPSGGSARKSRLAVDPSWRRPAIFHRTMAQMPTAASWCAAAPACSTLRAASCPRARRTRARRGRARRRRRRRAPGTSGGGSAQQQQEHALAGRARAARQSARRARARARGGARRGGRRCRRRRAAARGCARPRIAWRHESVVPS